MRLLVLLDADQDPALANTVTDLVDGDVNISVVTSVDRLIAEAGDDHIDTIVIPAALDDHAVVERLRRVRNRHTTLRVLVLSPRREGMSPSLRRVWFVAARAVAISTGTGTLRDRRIRAGLTQLQLAARVGVRQATISSWETGATKPRRRHLEQLNKVFRETPAVRAPGSPSDAVIDLRSNGAAAGALIQLLEAVQELVATTVGTPPLR